MKTKIHSFFIAFLFFIFISGVSPTNAEDFMDKLGHMLDRVTDKITTKAEERLNSSSDKAINAAFDNTDNSVECMLTDKECIRQKFNDTDQSVPQASSSLECVVTDAACLKMAQSMGKQVKIIEPPRAQILAAPAANTMKCLVTDVACLKEAQTTGKQVQIVDEKDVDKFRCQVTDIECLQKAKSLGKQVEIVD